MGAVYENLSEFERETVAYLETLSQMSIGDLLDAECSNNALERYLRKSFRFLCFSLRLLPVVFHSESHD
jgi:hypothetical protein